MTGQELFYAIGEVREEWITDADEKNLRSATRPGRARWLARRLGACAVCLAILLTAGIGFTSWYYPLGAHEEVLRLTPIILNDRFMQYELVRLGEGQEAILPHRRGSYVGELQGREVWHLQEREDCAELILHDGEDWKLVRLNDYSVFHTDWRYEAEAAVDWIYADLLTPEEWAQIDTSAYTFGEVLRNIYAADCADDIAWVRFEKSNIDNTRAGRSVKVKTVTLRDAESIAQMWDVLVGLMPHDDRLERPQSAVTHPDVLAVQTVRDVTVHFKGGAELTFEYNPAGGEDCGLFYRLEGYSPYYLTVEQNRALVALAGISFAPTPIPETEPLRGVAETAVPPSLPETIPE